MTHTPIQSSDRPSRSEGDVPMQDAVGSTVRPDSEQRIAIVDATRPFEREGALSSGEDARVRAIVLAGLPAVIALMWAEVPSAARPWFVGAVAWIALANIAGYVLPWRSLPRWSEMVPPMSTMVAIWLLAASVGGSGAIFGALILVPLLWLALYADPGEVVFGFALAAACILAPVDLLIPALPEQGSAAETALLLYMAFVITVGVRPIMRQLRSQVRRNRRAIAALDASQAALVHDLRNPLAAVRSLATLAERRLEQDTPDAADKVKEYARVMLASTERAERIIDGVLELSQAGELLPWAEPFDLRSLAEEVASGVTGVTVDASAAPATVVGHRPSIARLLSNLFENAAAHAAVDRSPDAPPVHVTVSGGENSSGWTITVRDDGRGIDPSIADSLFEPWHRGAGSSGTGSGLGLAIVAGIVAQHGGHITASNAEPHGAAFTFTLARRPAVARAGGASGDDR